MKPSKAGLYRPDARQTDVKETKGVVGKVDSKSQQQDLRSLTRGSKSNAIFWGSGNETRQTKQDVFDVE